MLNAISLKNYSAKRLICSGLLLFGFHSHSIAAPYVVTASTHDGNVPENIVDGNLEATSRWSANGLDQWVQIDLGEVKTLASVDIAFFKGNQRSSSFELWIGENVNALAPAGAHTSSSTSLDFESFDITDQNVQFLRYIGKGNSVNNWNSLTEMRPVFAKPAPPPPAPNQPIATSSSDDGNVAANVLDGVIDASSRWSALGLGEWIQIDLGSRRKITAVDIAFFKGDVRNAIFSVLVGDDAANPATEVYKGQSSAGTLDFERFTLIPTQGRYLRFFGQGNSANAWNSITEMRVISEPIDTTPPAPTPSGPYLGVPHAIPGTIEAEHYDYAAFSDTTAGNAGGLLRTDDVDITGSGNAGGHKVGWIQANEWLEYSVNINESTTYDLQALVSSKSNGSQFQLLLDGAQIATITVPVTGDWNNFMWTNQRVDLPVGEYKLRVNFIASGMDLDALRIKKASNTPPPPPGDSPAYCAALPTAPKAGQWQSSKVFYDGGRLKYATDASNNRIPDYSYAGYHYGQTSLPNVPVVSTLGPVSGDNTARIQNALDAIGQRAKDENGFRGALLLKPGKYNIDGSIYVRHSGVVLRGSGDGSNPGTDTILYGRGTNQRTILYVGSGNDNPWTTSGKTNITNSFVGIGAMQFNVQSTSGLAVGQDIKIVHPSSQAWINAVDGGNTGNDAPWSAGTKDIIFIRKIMAINGKTLSLDAPLYNHLDKSLTQSYVAPITSKSTVAEVGLENLRVDIVTKGGEDEAHPKTAVAVQGAEDAWVKKVTTLHFIYSGILTSGASRVTIEDSRALDPVGKRIGARFYNFNTEKNSQLILFSGCQASDGRHEFVSNGTSTVSGVVFHQCKGTADSQSEGHRQWTQGMLFDNVYATSTPGKKDATIQLINRGDWGTGHGWSTVHSVVWNFNRTIYAQRPSTAQNYAISDKGNIGNWTRHAGPQGFHEKKPGELFPKSLYQAQLCDRLKK